MLAGDFARQLSTRSLRDFATHAIRQDFERLPVDLAWTVKAQSPTNVFDDQVLRNSALLEIGTGAAIVGDPHSTFFFSSETRLRLDGRISAPGGAINATLKTGISGNRLTEFLGSQTLWLGPEANLSTAGVFESQPDPRGIRAGEVLSGGNVTLNAESGYLVAQAGSFIDVRGTRAVLDLTQPGAMSAATRATEIGSDGGQISLRAAEGIIFDGELRAQAGTVTARAGSLLIELDAQARNDNADFTHDQSLNTSVER
jgi:filamentous hemagglutinin